MAYVLRIGMQDDYSLHCDLDSVIESLLSVGVTELDGRRELGVESGDLSGPNYISLYKTEIEDESEIGEADDCPRGLTLWEYASLRSQLVYAAKQTA